ncbi:MAG: trehalase family glycosidase [Candidatus Curtissbacteria bacterium]|nr:trehalase family glycosidase [Candidatus Curtissbacteria bacterium]
MSPDQFSKYLKQKDIDEVLAYIDSYWPKLIKSNPKDLRSLIGLPNPYIVPAASEVFQEQYYWDSYPVVRVLIDHPKYRNIAIGMVDNLLHLVERFGIVPNASRFYFLSRSQPPLLSSMVSVVYDKTGDKTWLKRAIKFLEDEYNNVWMGKIQLRNYRLTWTGLSRYYDLNAMDILAEAESGWDMTARFGGKCLAYCPVDLNSLLYIYERDLSESYKIFGNLKKEEMYRKAAEKRVELVNKYMWNEEEGYYFDYNFEKEHISPLITVAGVFPLNVGIASFDQAKRAVSMIEKELQRSWGVVQSVKFVENKQWDWPNGWAPMQLRVVESLLRYGYIHLAKRFMTKWIALNVKVFKETGQLWEKYDVVHGRVGVPDRYPTAPGFAWTNAVFVLMVKMLKQIENAPEGATPVFMVRRLGWF